MEDRGARGDANRGPGAGRHHSTMDLGSAETLGAEAPVRDAPPSGRFGPYVILERLGAGGMGVVYAAYDRDLDRKVAVKVLRSAARDESGRDRLLREAQTMARLRHPNVVTVYSVGETEGQIYVAMELVARGTLRRWMGERRRTWREVQGAFLQAGAGLGAAHEAGLVHRDFKPDNVLVDGSGTMRVSDFGLARSEATVGRPPPEEDPRSLVDASLTRTGALFGTPAYMAPEQHEGQSATQKSDQFAFSVALYEALYGRLPFGEGTVAEVITRTKAGRILPAPNDTSVPRWLDRIVRKGLSVEPTGRFGSMGELLDALRRDTTVRRRRLMLGGATAVAVAIAALAIGSPGPRTVCRGAERKLRGIWDGPTRASVHRAFMATRASYAADAWRTVERALNRRADAWVQAHTEACEATQVRGEASEDMLDRRMVCLARQLHEMDALTSLFARADSDVVERAPESAQRLSSPNRCLGESALAPGEVLPAEPRARAATEKLRAELTDTRTLRDAGKYSEGLRGAQSLAKRARAMGNRVVLAEVLSLQGDLEDWAGDTTAAERTLYDAINVAQASRHAEVSAVAASDLSFVVGAEGSRYAEGRRWAEFAAASIHALGGSDELESRRLNNLANVCYAEGKYDDAEGLHRRALDLHMKVYGPQGIRVGKSLHNLANVYYALGRYSESDEYHRRSQRILEGQLGRDHPVIAQGLSNHGATLEKMHRFEDAAGIYRRALAIQERALSPDHGSLLATHNNLALVLRKLGRLDEAALHTARAVEIGERLGPDHPYLAEALVGMAALEHARGRERLAIGTYERALEIQARALGAEHPDLAYPLAGIGESYLVLGDAARAAEALERALGLLEKAHVEPLGLAKTRFGLARAQWARPPQRPRARELARQARDAFAAAGADARDDLSEVDAWLAAR
ncbi:MAG: serine/threonine protein kinase [Deltaproteobacteria bacterium]|nr:serine/threonine protein kinase [Deltaproteobacteria bacterium]